MGGTGQPVPPIVVETKMVLLIARYCSGPAEIATAGPVETANFGSTEKATTRILSYPLY